MGTCSQSPEVRLALRNALAPDIRNATYSLENLKHAIERDLLSPEQIQMITAAIAEFNRKALPLVDFNGVDLT